MALVHFQCPSCGAELPPRAPSDEVTCEYCSTRFAPERARAAKTAAGEQLDATALAQLRGAQQALTEATRELSTAREARKARREARRERRRGRGVVRRLISAVGSLLLFAFMAGVIGLMMIASGAIDIADIPWLRELELVGDIEAKLDPEGVDAFSGPPMLVEIGAAPAIVVRVREHARQELYVDAYMLPSAAGGELERRWRIGPLGSGKQLEHARFTIAGAWVVVSTSGRELQVHELATGARVRTIELRAEVDYLCTAEPDVDTVYVRQTKARHQLLTVSTGKLVRAAKEPLGCETWRAAELDPSVVALDTVKLANEFIPRGSRVSGGRDELGQFVGATRILVDSDKARGAALVVGDAGPRILGFTHEPDTQRKPARFSLGEPTWTVDVPAAEPWPITATLAHGRIVTAWQHADHTTRVSAHGIDDGALAWTETIELEPGDRVIALRGGASHVIVVRAHALDVLDASSGARLASLGAPPD